MTTSVFPADKTQPFVADNGVTYVYESDRWRVKQYKLEDAALQGYVTEEEFDKDQKRQDDVIKDLTSTSTTTCSCKVTRSLTNTEGDMWTMLLDPSLVYTLIFSPTDLNGDQLPLLNTDDYIDVTNTSGEVNHYVVSRRNATDPGYTYTVKFLYGEGEWTDNEEVSVAFITTTTDYVEQEEFEESQGVQDNQINALETQIQLLAQVSAVGKWKYVRNISGGSVRPPATASFYATHKDGVDIVLMDWADARLIMINKTDLDGTVFTFSEFEEGDKLEILAVDGSSACYGTVTNNPNQDAYGNMIITVERSNGGPPQSTEKEFLLSVYRPGASNGSDLDALDNRYLIKTGDEMEGTLTGKLFKSIRNTGYAFEVKPDNIETTAIIRNDGRAEFTKLFIDADLSSPSGKQFEVVGRLKDGTTIDSTFFYAYNNADGTPSAVNYNGKMDSSSNIVTKGYVDSVVSGGAGVAVGTIMMWINSAPPTGWFKLKGEAFDVDAYPLLHAYLEKSDGYTSGKLPDWRGHYPGQLGDHLNGDVGIKLGQRTAKPNAGSPYCSKSIPNGSTRTFNAGGGTNAYSDGVARPSIDSGWDDETRPKTIAVHFIIKHD